MSLVNIDPQKFSDLKGKVVVVLGATTGIGAAVVSQLTDVGAKVVWGDVAAPSPPDPRFVRTDASSYASVLHLFRAARRQHGRVDHAVCNAGVGGADRLFTTSRDAGAAIEEEPPTRVLDVNLKGPLFFARIAVHFLRRGPEGAEAGVGKGKGKDGGDDDDDDDDDGDAAALPSILLVGSNAGFTEFPGTWQYSASKHGVMGLFRSAKGFLLEAEGIRLNVVLPDLTKTPMTTAIADPLQALGVPCNEPEDVARAVAYALASTGTTASGEAYYVSGGRTYEIEKRLQALRPQWLGADLDRNLAVMQEGFRQRTFKDHELRKAGEL